VDEMVFVGWRCSVESYAKIIEALEVEQVQRAGLSLNSQKIRI
jgi:hypothetical protein